MFWRARCARCWTRLPPLIDPVQVTQDLGYRDIQLRRNLLLQVKLQQEPDQIPVLESQLGNLNLSRLRIDPVPHRVPDRFGLFEDLLEHEVGSPTAHREAETAKAHRG